MVDSIHRIVAGHENQDAFAEEFLKSGVVAVGWDEVGDITRMNEEEVARACERYDNPKEGKSVLLRFRDRIKIGDVVIAYKSPNTVVAVGRMASDYFFDDTDNLGSAKGLGYPHKRKVIWREKPRMFDRNFLPEDFSSLVALPGTFKTLEYDFGIIEKALDAVPEEAERERVLEVESEEQMRLYFKNNIKQLEPDLIALDDRDTSVGQVDILARAGDSWVVIELKRDASDSAVGQLLGYMGAVGKDQHTDKVRGIIVGESITSRAKQAIGFLNAFGIDMSLYTCELRFVAKKVIPD